MADKKDPRYNWIHIPENYFDRVKTKIIRNTENGNTKIVLYFKMLDAVKNTDGYYMFQRATQSISEEIAIQINEDAKLVKATLDTLSNLDLVEIEEDGCYFDEADQFVGSVAESTLRVQEYRAREKAKKAREAKQANVTKETNSNNMKQHNVTSETGCNIPMLQGKQDNVTSEMKCNTEREKEREKEEDKEINNNCAKSSYPKDADEVVNMFNEYCPSLGKAPKSDEMSDSIRQKLVNCLLSPLSIDNYKKVFIDAEKESDKLKQRTQEKQYSNEFELVLDVLQELGKELQKKATAQTI